jgi:acyl-CoA thioesterase YciA
MPADTNPAGDIFGGWVLAQMDIAGGILARERAKGRVATIGIEAMTFHKPVMVGDLVSCYCEIVRIGRTSIAVQVETWVLRQETGEEAKVTEGRFTYVAIDADRKPRPVRPAAGAA